ncbi:MAG: glycosyltransferase family 2 protein [Candidatus Omnitrophota bacterium]
MPKDLSVSFVLPMYNERDNIAYAVKEISSLAPEVTNDHEIIFVDDASTDGSADAAEEIAQKDNRVKVFRLTENTKFGGAFAKGFKSAAKDVIVYMDSDMPVKPEDVKASFPLIADADIVTGYSRVRKGDTLKRKIISGIYNLMVQALFGLKIKDINSGYKIVRRRVAENMEFISRSPFVDVELFLEAKRKGYKVKQFPLVFRSRFGGKSCISSFPIMLATFRDMIKVKILSCRKNS